MSFNLNDDVIVILYIQVCTSPIDNKLANIYMKKRKLLFFHAITIFQMRAEMKLFTLSFLQHTNLYVV